jgi:hypothetical protein
MFSGSQAACALSKATLEMRFICVDVSSFGFYHMHDNVYFTITLNLMTNKQGCCMLVRCMVSAVE